MQRESGESGQWQRINRLFVHELRKQLLIWRSMDQATHEQLNKTFRDIVKDNQSC
jgi:hypothetical protein